MGKREKTVEENTEALQKRSTAGSMKGIKIMLLMITLFFLYYFIKDVVHTITYDGPDLPGSEQTATSSLELGYSGLDHPESPVSGHAEASSGDAVEIALNENNAVNLYNNNWFNNELYSIAPTAEDTYFETVCFLGDSRTKGLLEYSDLPDWNGYYEVGYTAKQACTNRIFTVDGYSGLYNMLEVVELIDYEIYYLGFGTNELPYNDSEKFIEEYKVLIDKIKSSHPDAVIYIESILPMGNNFSENNPSFSNERAEEYNEALLNMCKEYGDLIYIDIAECMKDESGAAIRGSTGDGLHYDPYYYQIIMEYIRNSVVDRKNT